MARRRCRHFGDYSESSRSVADSRRSDGSGRGSHPDHCELVRPSGAGPFTRASPSSRIPATYSVPCSCPYPCLSSRPISSSWPAGNATCSACPCSSTSPSRICARPARPCPSAGLGRRTLLLSANAATFCRACRSMGSARHGTLGSLVVIFRPGVSTFGGGAGGPGWRLASTGFVVSPGASHRLRSTSFFGLGPLSVPRISHYPPLRRFRVHAGCPSHATASTGGDGRASAGRLSRNASTAAFLGCLHLQWSHWPLHPSAIVLRGQRTSFGPPPL